MKWTTRILFVLAISTATAVIAMVSNQRNRTPELTLDSIEETLERDDYNQSTLIRALDTALNNSQRSGDHTSQIRALRIRGDLYLEIGAPTEARRDYEQIKALLPAPDESILLRLVQADIESGDPESGQRRIEELLSIAPDSSNALVQRGRLHLASATQRKIQCEGLLMETLAPQVLHTGIALVDQLSAQDLLDPERAGAVSQLRELLPRADGERLSRILVLSDEASVFSREARVSFERSFAFSMSPEGIYEYINLLMRSKQSEKAMRFGAQARTHEGVKEDNRTTLALIQAHHDAKDLEGAGTLAAELIQATRELNTNEYALCCKALYNSQRWSGLFFAAGRMRTIGTSVDAIESSLYLGLAQYGRKRYSNARTLLRSFAKSTLPDPIPNAHYLAWSILAELDRSAEAPFFERESVHAALKSAPPGEESKIFWQRLGELQMADGHTDSSLPLRSFSEAISNSTEAAPNLMANFELLGKKAREDEGRDIGLIYQELVRENRSLPSIPLNSFDLLTLAEMHAANGNDLAVVSVCRRLLDNLPGFYPAVDLMINAQLSLGRDRSAIAQIVDRIDVTGLDEVSMRFLQRLPRDPFSTEQLHRVMRADPAFTGKLEIARRLRAIGERESALACLVGKGSDLSPEEALLAATIHAELGDREAAKTRLSAIQASTASYPQAMLFYARLGSISNDTVAIDVSVDALLATKDVSNIRTLVKQLLFDRKLERVAPALAALSELSGESDPWVLEHYVLYRLVRGEAEKAREAASRAEFFSLSYRAPMGMILASTIKPDRAQVVKDSELFLNSFPEAVNQIAKAAIALLADRPALAKELLENEGPAEERAPEWALITVAAEALGHDIGMKDLSDDEVSHARRLLLGSADKPRDPLTSLGVLLSAQTQFFAPYALEKLNEYAGQERDAWSSYLIASTLKRGNELGRARDAIWTAAQDEDNYFQPARDLFEDLERARLGSLDHPGIDALHRSALRSKARLAKGGVAALLVKALDALNASDTNAANAACLEALSLAPLDHEALATMALVKFMNNDFQLSLNHWIQACETAPSSHLQSYVGKSLQCIEDALAFFPPRLVPSNASDALATISSYATRDPRLPLLWAKLDLLKDPDNPAMGVSRAFLRLENYMHRHRKTGVADLRPGTEEDWIAFYMAHGPEQALDFCRQQLRLSPGAYSLWLGEVRALRALGRPGEALIAAKVLLKINATPELHEEIAACLQESGRTTQEVERELTKASKARGGRLSVDGILTRTKSLLSVRGERAASKAIASLSRTWDQDATGPINEQQSEVGLILAEGFLKRNQPGDLRSAKVLLEEVSKRGTNPYARSLANALAGLYKQS